jgi:CBS domain-containing protein
MKPRIFLGSSGQQEKLLQALTRGLQDIADVDPWTTVFNPGVSTLDRLVELTREVDFAAFVFAQDDWTTKGASPDAVSGQASPRDNVVFEAGLFGGVLGIRRTFILHANGAKLPTDLLGLTSIRYEPDATPAIVRQINQQLRKAIDAEGRISRLEGDWWQLSLTARTELEPSAVSLLTIVTRAVAERRNPQGVRVEEIASHDLVTVESEQDLDEALALMARHKVRRLPVLEEGRLVGMLEKANVALEAKEEKVGEMVEQISQPT